MSLPRIALPFLLAALPAVAHEGSEDTVIHSGTDLLEWCRRESEAWHVGAGKRPTNWRARHYEKGNVLYVEGRWRVEGEDLECECRVARGARAGFAELDAVVTSPD